MKYILPLLLIFSISLNSQFDPCDQSQGGPGCIDGGGDIFSASEEDSIQPYQTVTFFVGLLDTLTWMIDTTFSGNATVSVVSGPGDVLGTLSQPIDKWAFFDDLMFDTEGTYELEFSNDQGYSSSLRTIVVSSLFGGGGSGGSGESCFEATHGDRTNLGLYGGSTTDLTFGANGRLFAAVETPASMYQSDDTAKTWYPSFEVDSLEYDCGRGWGGRAMQVLVNDSAWVGVLTLQQAGTLTSAVISYSNGDTASYETAVDPSMLNDIGFQVNGVKSIDMTDYYFYVGGGTYVAKVNPNEPLSSSSVVDITPFGFPASSTVAKIAAVNDPSGYPFYCVIDTTGDFNANNGMLYIHDGSTMYGILPPSGMTAISNVFTHPHQSSRDTVFVNAMDNMGMTYIYKTLDGGITWTDITPSGGNWGLSDVTYSSSWASTVAVLSNGLCLTVPGVAVSYDMGVTWLTTGLVNTGTAILPTNPNIVVGSRGRGVVVSETGPTGIFTIADNIGMESVGIQEIVRTENKGLFYIATKAGLAYTTAYLDDAVDYFDKWNAPYGEFPIENVGDDAGIFSVAIDPNDSLHVVAGYSNGFSVTTTGPSGFSNIQPSGWDTGQQDPRVNDIEFVSSDIVIAVTGGENQISSGQGNIWRSDDGGASWLKVTPTSDPFSNGNVIAVGSASDTVIYVGTGLEQSADTIDFGNLWESYDLGLTWVKKNDGPDAINGPATMMPIFDIAVDPRSNDTIYIASGSNLDNALVRSNDGGLTYDFINVSGEGAFTSVMLHDDYPDTVYAAIRREIFIYDAVNDSVVLGFRGLPGEVIPDLVFGSVIAGTSQGAYLIGIDEEGVEGIVSVDKEKPLSPITVYPNPSTGEFNIQIDAYSSNEYQLIVFDISGRIVLNETKSVNEGFNTFNINLDIVPSGSYYLVLTNSESRMVTKLLKN